MKIKLQPGGKLILTLFLLIILYIILSVTGFFKLFSPKTNVTETNLKVEKSFTLNRPLKVGYTDENFCPGGFFSNDGLITLDNSIFSKKFKQNVKFSNFSDESKLFDFFMKGGDSNGVDLAITSLDQFVLNYSKLYTSNPLIFLVTEKIQNKDLLISRSYITNLKYLDGKRIAVVRNSPMHYFLMDILKDAKINLKKIKFIYTGNDKQSFAKLNSKGATATVIRDFSILEIAQKDKNLLNLLTGLPVNSNVQVVIAKESFLKKYPLTIKYFSHGILIANDSLLKNPTLLTETVKKYCKVNFPAGEIDLNSKFKLTNYMDNISLFGIDSNVSVNPLINEIEKVKNIWSLAGNNVFQLYPNQLLYTETIKSLKDEFKNTNVKKEKQIDTVKTTVPGSANTSDKVTIQTETKSKPSFDQTHTAVPELVFDKNKLTVYFGPNIFHLDTVTKTKLDEFVKSFKADNTKIDIFGNADSTGQDIYNFMISRWRSKAVADYLIHNHKISSERFNLIGNGSRKPVASNINEKGRKKNRRADILVKTK